MKSGESRSREVIDSYKRHKLAASALRRIHELLQGFERDRAADRKLALFGMCLLILVLLYLAYRFSGSMTSIVIS